MKYISEKKNRKVISEIRKNGFDNYLKNRTLCEDVSNESVVVKINGSIEDYAQRNGYISAKKAFNKLLNTSK